MSALLKNGRNFAVSAWVWNSDPSIDNYAFIFRAAELGFDGVEIPTFDGNLDTGVINNVLESQSKRIFPIVVGGGSPNADLASESESIRINGINYLKKLIQISNEIGSELICGPLYTSVGKTMYLKEKERASVIRKVAASLKIVSSFAEEHGVKIALEPLCRYDTHLINTTEQAMRLIELIDSESVGILLDTFHMNIEERSIRDAVRLSNKLLFHVQVCENDRGAPGTGQIDWELFRDSILEINYNGWISLESFTPLEANFSTMMHAWRKLENTQDELAFKGLKFLKNLLNQ